MRIADLRALREKYEEMLALRVLHERAREEPEFDEPDPRSALASLAARFPGALREIDELPLDAIRGRIDALLRAESGGGRDVEPWMEAQVLVHGLARGVLAAKRWLGKRRTITPMHREAFWQAIDDRKLPSEAIAWGDDLAHVARPPRGRLMDLVYARAAKKLDVAPARVRELAFGPPRRR